MNQGEIIWASTCVDDLEMGGDTCEKSGYKTDFGKWRQVKLGFKVDFSSILLLG